MGKKVQARRDITVGDVFGDADTLTVIPSGTVVHKKKAYGRNSSEYVVVVPYFYNQPTTLILPDYLFADVLSWTLQNIVRALTILQARDIDVYVGAVKQHICVVIEHEKTWFDDDERFVTFLRTTVPEAFDD